MACIMTNALAMTSVHVPVKVSIFNAARTLVLCCRSCCIYFIKGNMVCTICDYGFEPGLNLRR